MLIQLIVLTSLSFIYSSRVISDTCITFHDSCIEWKFIDKKGDARFSSAAALHGSSGLQMELDSRTSYLDISGIVPFQEDFWLTYYIRVDDYTTDEKSSSQIDFFCVDFSRLYSDAGLPAIVYSVGNDANIGGLYLCNRLQPSRTENDKFSSKTGIKRGEIYCIESNMKFVGPDSIILKSFINGRPLLEAGSHFNYARDKTSLLLYAEWSGAAAKCRLSLDEFAITNTQKFSVPPRPTGGIIFPDSVRGQFDHIRGYLPDYPRPLLQWDSIKTNYEGEQLLLSEWRIYSAKSENFPLYNRIHTDLADCRSIILPFPLDSGRYSFMTRYKNNFGNWGDWSYRCSILVDRSRDIPIEILKIFFTEQQDTQDVSELKPGIWYDLHVHFVTAGNMDTIGYFMMYMHDSTYQDGNPANKGGVFLPTANFKVNISYNGDNFTIFEGVENESRSLKLAGGVVGKFIDCSQGKVIFDPVRGKLRLTMRLSAKAQPGHWHIVGCFRTYRYDGKRARENSSNIFERTILIGSSVYYSNWLVFGIPIASILFIGVLFFVRHKRSKIKRNSIEARQAIESIEISKDPQMERIFHFISQNFDKDLTVHSICTDLKIAEHNFYQIFRRNGIKFAKYLNLVRIEKAKELLLTTDKKVTDIALLVGFLDPDYFYKLFKAQTNLTPSEFRQSIIKDFPAN